MSERNNLFGIKEKKTEGGFDFGQFVEKEKEKAPFDFGRYKKKPEDEKKTNIQFVESKEYYLTPEEFFLIESGIQTALEWILSQDRNKLFFQTSLPFLEPNNKLIKSQYACKAGSIDILTQKEPNTLNVFELKRKEKIANKQNAGQLLAYMQAIKEEFPESEISGVFIAGGFNDGFYLTVRASLFNSKIDCYALKNTKISNEMYKIYLMQRYKYLEKKTNEILSKIQEIKEEDIK